MGLERSFQYNPLSVNAVCGKYGRDHVSDSMLQVLNWSSEFTGMASAEMARHSLRQTLTNLGLNSNWQTTSLCDNNIRSQKYLATHYNCHCFDNIFGFYDFAHGHGMFEATSYFERWQAIENAHFHPYCHCVQHGGRCDYPQSCCAIGGFPCTPWSAAGNGLGLEHKDSSCMLAWSRLHTELATPLVIGENSTKIFDYALSSNFPRHNMQRVRISPASCGFPHVSRERSYFLFNEKSKSDVMFPLQEVVDTITNELQKKPCFVG
jgi:hypothetical protein